MSQLFVLPKPLNIDANLRLVAGCRAYFYATGTSTPQNVYQDAELTIPHANPVVADAAGVLPPIYLDDEDPAKTKYRLTLRTASDALIYTADPVNPFNLTTDGVVNVLTANAVGGVLYPKAEGEFPGDSAISAYQHEIGNVLRYGADPTGLLDSTAAIQRAVNQAWASGFYSHPWSGNGGISPIVYFPPGRYRVTGSITVPTGVTLRGFGHPAHTTSHTRIIMDSTASSPPNGAGDNRNKPMFKFNRATMNGAVLMNAACTSTIDGLEFWYVTGSNDFNNPTSGSGLGFNDYPDGGTLVFDVDAADFRIQNCCFQHSPAPIRIINVSTSTVLRPDGFNGNRGVGLFIENCEFDSGACHIFANDSYVDLTFKACQFFGTRHVYDVCTGRVSYQSCRFHGGCNIDAAGLTLTHAACDLDEFVLQGCTFVHSSSAPSIAINKAALVHIGNNHFSGASGQSCIELTDVDGGAIVGNSIDSSGFNASAGTGIADFVGAIKGRGIRNVLISGNNISATESGTYNGFGILLGDSARASQTNFVHANAVTAPYNGATHASQNRYINVASGDVRGINYDAQISTTIQSSGPLIAMSRVSGPRVVPTYGASITIDVSLGNQFAIVVTNGSNFTIANPSNALSVSGQRITLQIMNFSGGAMGTITWGGQYKLATWTNPANNNMRSIDFQWDSGGAWREVCRTPADVPNA